MKFLISIMNSRQRKVFYYFALSWLLFATVFWTWWLSHFASSVGYLVSTLMLGWLYFMPLYFLFFISKMKRVNPRLKIPQDWKVAMIVTKAPSEPWEVVKQTLLAMLKQKYPHDTWLADEQPTKEVRAWCKENGVRISSRYGVDEYHNATWPRRTKSKEGNLAYFYDKYGYKKYDFVVQLDADHVPTRGYLEHMLRPFIAEKVGYVSAPSICDSNAPESWSARARLFAESTMHGILQAGYNDGWAPLCIGSHYAVRTKALKEIGGIGPELAEDHSTTFLMNAHDWRGIHAFDAKANGDGPATFSDFMTQEFQWARSLIVLLFTVTPKHIKKLPMNMKFQFMFSQLWYPIFAFQMFIGLLLPIIALMTKTPIVEVSYLEFVFYSAPATISLLLFLGWLKENGWLRSKDSAILSWESIVFQLARWPWVLWGFVAAIVGVIQKKTLAFKVTPKGDIDFEPVPIRILLPYLVIISVYALALLFVQDPEAATGYYYFAILNLGAYSFAVITIVIKHVFERYYAK